MRYAPDRVLTRPPDPSELPGQFILTTRQSHLPPTWESQSAGGWMVGYDRRLPVTTLEDPGGQVLGWLLGHAVSTTSGLLRTRWVIPQEAAATPGGVEQALYGLSGRWVAVTLSPPRVYLDPLGSHSTVYSPEDGIVASTTGLVPHSRATPFDRRLITELDMPYGMSMFPVGLTCRHRIERLLPNHYLDLRTWTRVRHWSLAQAQPVADRNAAYDTVAARLRALVAGVAAHWPLDVSLTAGRDSRLLAAYCRPWIDRTRFYTYAIGDADAWRDAYVAGRIAAEHNLTHAVLRGGRARVQDLHGWVVRTGGETAERRGWRSIRCPQLLDPARASVVSVASDVLRGGFRRLIRFTDPEPRKPSVEGLMIRIGVPRLPDLVARVGQWMEEAPARHGRDVTDLFYIEQRSGSWGGVIQHAETGYTAARLFAVADRHVLEVILTRPADERNDDVIYEELIRREWPELLSYPMNAFAEATPTQYRLLSGMGAVGRTSGRLGRWARQTLRDPKRTLRKIADRVRRRESTGRVT